MRHEPWPEHAISHDVAPLQLTPFAQALLVVQPILQAQPVGHTIGWLPVQFVRLQSMTHVFDGLSQLVHWGGQTLGGPSIDPSGLGPSPFFGASIGPPPGTTQ